VQTCDLKIDFGASVIDAAAVTDQLVVTPMCGLQSRFDDGASLCVA
jgi:hypothetical protein